ncbi:MAG: hypothetical protein QGD88_13110 [Anaerolineae bacterium]|nr:hypothetical protein [Anaerolineae bacterium]
MLRALFVFVGRKPAEQYLNAGSGLVVRVRLTASFTSLIIPGTQFGGIWPVSIGIFLGAASLLFVDQWISHPRFIKDRFG